MERTRRAAQLLKRLGIVLLALALPARAALDESVMRVPVVKGVEQAYIDVTVFKPSGTGPFPVVVLSHGSPRDAAERRLEGRQRMVAQSERFVAFQPFASTSPFETWIMPRFHQSSFGKVDDAALDELASALRAVLGGLRRALEDPDYNYVIYSAPPGDEDREYFVWHLRIVPRLLTPAGFELGSGIPVNPSRPEEAATTLRRSIDEEVAAQRGSARH